MLPDQGAVIGDLSDVLVILVRFSKLGNFFLFSEDVCWHGFHKQLIQTGRHLDCFATVVSFGEQCPGSIF
jgi:hypothetical protein